MTHTDQQYTELKGALESLYPTNQDEKRKIASRLVADCHDTQLAQMTAFAVEFLRKIADRNPAHVDERLRVARDLACQVTDGLNDYNTIVPHM